MKDKLSAFQFEVYEVDGHDMGAIENVLTKESTEKPIAIIAHTIRGYGSKTMMENDIWFHKAPNEEELVSLEKEIDLF